MMSEIGAHCEGSGPSKLPPLVARRVRGAFASGQTPQLQIGAYFGVHVCTAPFKSHAPMRGVVAWTFVFARARSLPD